MTARFSITIDCVNPNALARFWVEALGYVFEPPPDGFPTWPAYWRSRGLPEEELGDDDTYDVIIDPDGRLPKIWFQPVPEGKAIKNRLHLDITASGGRNVALETRRERVTAEANRLVTLGASIAYELYTDGLDHYGIVLSDPEGNEFCIN